MERCLRNKQQQEAWSQNQASKHSCRAPLQAPQPHLPPFPWNISKQSKTALPDTPSRSLTDPNLYVTNVSMHSHKIIITFCPKMRVLFDYLFYFILLFIVRFAHSVFLSTLNFRSIVTENINTKLGIKILSITYIIQFPSIYV